MINFCDEIDCPLHPDYKPPKLNSTSDPDMQTSKLSNDLNDQFQQRYLYASDRTDLNYGTSTGSTAQTWTTATTYEPIFNNNSIIIELDNNTSVNIKCLMCDKLKKVDIKKIMIAKEAKDKLLD